MRKLDIKANRAASNYSMKEYLLRLLWSLGRLFFALTPRPCFGLRRGILRVFGARIGTEVNIYPSAVIYYPWNLEIGDQSAIGEWALIYNLGKISIGQRSTISQRVHLCAGTHDYLKKDMPLLKPHVVIGNEVWVCADAFVGPGILIEDRSIVAARAVVVKNVPSSSIVGGNPAKFIKDRT